MFDEIKLNVASDTIDAFVTELKIGNEHKHRIGYLVGSVTGDTINITDMYIPKQESHETEYVVDASERQKVLDEISALGHEIVGYMHYVGDSKIKDTTHINEMRTQLASEKTPPVPVVSYIANSKRDRVAFTKQIYQIQMPPDLAAKLLFGHFEPPKPSAP